MSTLLEGGELLAARPGRILHPRKNRYTFNRRLGVSQGRSGRAENFAPPGFNARTVQPVVSRYTDWTTRPTERQKVRKENKNKNKTRKKCILPLGKNTV